MKYKIQCQPCVSTTSIAVNAITTTTIRISVTFGVGNTTKNYTQK